MPRPKLYANAHERRHAANKRRREREGWAAKPAPVPPRIPLSTSEAVALYRTERDSLARAERNAYAEDAMRAALARADADRERERRGGRPRRHGPNIHVGSASALDLLRRSRP